MKAFSLKIADISFNDNVSQGSGLVDGKITQQDWTGFASRFAWGDPDSPLKNLSHYFYSLGESTIMQNLITEFNQKLPGWRTSSDISAESAKLQQQAISNFMQTGQMQEVKFGAWAAPLLNGGVTIGRQIVVGSYLGADNMIQLADDYGFYMNAGIYLGILGLPSNVGVSGMIQGSISYTYTHLKPITDLKQATSEPLKKIVTGQQLGDEGG